MEKEFIRSIEDRIEDEVNVEFYDNDRNELAYENGKLIIEFINKNNINYKEGKINAINITMGYIANELNLPTSAIKYLELAKRYATKKRQLNSIRVGIAHSYALLGKLDEAKSMYIELIALYEEQGNIDMLRALNYRVAEFFGSYENAKKAVEYDIELYKEGIRNFDSLINTYRLFYRIAIGCNKLEDVKCYNKIIKSIK